MSHTKSINSYKKVLNSDEATMLGYIAASRSYGHTIEELCSLLHWLPARVEHVATGLCMEGFVRVGQFQRGMGETVYTVYKLTIY